MNRKFFHFTAAGVLVLFLLILSGCPAFDLKENPNPDYNPGSKSNLSAPTGLYASASSSSSVTLYWNSVSGASYYNVYYYTSNSSSNSAYYSYTYSTSLTVTGLNSNTAYYFWVKAVDYNYNESGFSSYAYATTTSSTPSSPTLTATAYSPSIVSLSWTSVSNAAKYYVYEGSSSSFSSSTRLGETTLTSIYVHSYSPGTSVYFWVTSVNSSGTEGSPSSYAYATTYTATSLSNGSWVNSSLSSSYPQRWYSFSATSGTNYYVWCDNAKENSSYTGDVVIGALYWNSTDWIFGGTNTTVDIGSSYQYFNASKSGTVYIRVMPWNNYSSYYGTYRIAYRNTSTKP